MVAPRWSPISGPSARQQLKSQDHRYRASVSHGVPVYLPAYQIILLGDGGTCAWVACAGQRGGWRLNWGPNDRETTDLTITLLSYNGT